jgi:hypothetical protein
VLSEPRANPGCFLGRGIAQLVVDRKGVHAHAVILAPRSQQKRQRHTVGTAGNSDRHPRTRQQWESCHGRGKGLIKTGLLIRGCE